MQCNYYSPSRFVKVSVRNFKLQHLPTPRSKIVCVVRTFGWEGRVLLVKGQVWGGVGVESVIGEDEDEIVPQNLSG
ncbi:hypothetical protein CEXT_429681 [Caerostris extrusa]|uniref:Uncharacterized protein n=1 Tax=Caerostris extrusa TaxID=172846 RepID=A0AAV4PWZ9_CAEEX|nr:hypothetical protein CEXT_429681 [Caerostris extrusa]